jgi:small-conductance mechanosensitive channel
MQRISDLHLARQHLPVKQQEHIRKTIKVGVAYGSPTRLVQNLLLEIAFPQRDVHLEVKTPIAVQVQSS